MTTDVEEQVPNLLLSLIIWLLPASGIKNKLLRLIGNSVGNGARLHPNLVIGCGKFIIAPEAYMGPFNAFREMRRLELGRSGYMGSFNWFSAVPGYWKYHPNAGTFYMGDYGMILNRHYFDCSGKIEMGPYSAIGGQRSILQTHEMNVETNEMSVGTIMIGDHALVGTGCLVLPGARLNDASILGAGSLLGDSKKYEDDHRKGLWAGRPAKFIREMSGGWLSRTEQHSVGLAVQRFVDTGFDGPSEMRAHR